MDLNETKTCGLDYLIRDKDKWRAVMNKVMNFQVPRNVGNIFSN